MSKKRLVTIILSFVALVAIGGCGGGGGSSSSTENKSGGTVIGPSGGTVEITDLSSPLYGTKLEVPAGALTETTTISIEPYDGTFPLPQGISSSETVIKLAPEGLRFSKAATLTIPYADSIIPVIVSYNQASNTYEVLPITDIDEQNKKVTVVTTHFSLLGKIKDIIMEGDIDTGFNIPDDAFGINNDYFDLFGTAYAETGACWGFAVYSKWYFDKKKAADGRLRGKYGCNEKGVVSDAMAQQRKDFEMMLARSPNWLISVNQSITRRELYLALLLTNKPQVLGLCTNTACLGGDAHAVLVYGTAKNADGHFFEIYENIDNSAEFRIMADNLGGFKDYERSDGMVFKHFLYLGSDSFVKADEMQGLYDKYKNVTCSNGYSISGKVTSGGLGLQGATVGLIGVTSAAATTDSSGNYSFSGVANGNYTITPSKSGYTFTPSSRTVAVNNLDVTNQDFAATQGITDPAGLVGSWRTFAEGELCLWSTMTQLTFSGDGTFVAACRYPSYDPNCPNYVSYTRGRYRYWMVNELYSVYLLRMGIDSYMLCDIEISEGWEEERDFRINGNKMDWWLPSGAGGNLSFTMM